MDYEKKYKDALERARTSFSYPDYPGFMRVDVIFPELKESEDERVKKRILLSLEKDLMVTKNSGCDTQDLEQCIAWLEKQGESYTKKDIDDAYMKGICVAKHELEKQGTPEKLSEEEQNSFAKGVLSNCALSFINYLDAHSYEGKMCVSNGECEDIDYAFHNAMWDRLHRYYCKYIEKQGEQKPIMNVPTREVILSIWDLGNEWKELTNGSISTEYGTQLDYIQKHWYESEYYLREKQGEQKPVLDFKASNWYVSKVDGKIHDMTYNSTDKVEPKFKIGDYIVSDYCMGRVVEITNDAYLLDTEQGIPFSCSNTRLWDVTKDAKDGDVLACGDKVTDCPFIFHNLTEELNPRSYCGVAKCQHFQYNDENCGFWCHSDEVRPATKEQRELLFKKMEEAGYEWNDEKKELKKIHVIDDGKAEMDYCFTKMMAGEKVSPAWSDEDDYNLQCMIAKVTSDIQKGNVGRNNELIDWLKSLKDRATWKPSEEQIHAFIQVYVWYSNNFAPSAALTSLYNDLKKL